MPGQTNWTLRNMRLPANGGVRRLVRMILADVYDQLNRLFGTPGRVDARRPDVAFRQHTTPLLRAIEHYLTPRSRVLIVGCGNGLEIEWFAQRCQSVIATDVKEYLLDAARERGNWPNVSYRLVDAQKLPFQADSFDLIFAHDVCEHLIYPENCFEEYARILVPHGVMINAFAPLFYSPFGAHLFDTLKMPWGHLIFGVQAVRELRTRYGYGNKQVQTWADLGLNRLTERRYRRIVQRVGFEHIDYRLHISGNLTFMRYIPGLRNFFIQGINDVLRRT
jgi:ubiquinone/menaquinone biosynthesis C-methylase UbiE